MLINDKQEEDSFPKMSSSHELVAEANEPQRGKSSRKEGSGPSQSKIQPLHFTDDVSSCLYSSADTKTSCMTVFTVDCFASVSYRGRVANKEPVLFLLYPAQKFLHSIDCVRF